MFESLLLTESLVNLKIMSLKHNMIKRDNPEVKFTTLCDLKVLSDEDLGGTKLERKVMNLKFLDMTGSHQVRNGSAGLRKLLCETVIVNKDKREKELEQGFPTMVTLGVTGGQADTNTQLLGKCSQDLMHLSQLSSEQ